MGSKARKAFGCGCGTILAIVTVIACVGWTLSLLNGPNPIRTLQPVPDNVPPAGGVEVPLIDVQAPGRTSAKLKFWAEPLSADTGISIAALQAYGNAELIAAQSWPNCHLRWNTLAGLGQVETRHGTYSGKIFGGSKIDADGNVAPPIIGVPLDGSPGFAKIADTDGGALDGDTEHDRAVGPMQFIPESWKRYGRDANGDGKADPHNIDDAAVSAANLLCDHDRDLATPQGWTAAVRSYNQSDKYLRDVRDAAAAYALRQPAS
ncbi:lytic transglycosylase domain-containing protein [Corynebacterium epidermidicanis]|uniref:Transglycosylase SLT domain n=1 Tax=Corynebacterium epidermidicanis TaxID=1050174 RepID=A0A0G3GQA3_9CORY|nr:lytic murein transglycosylase [Corynebacterium epidermidicanis]AKK02735.1 Transglycosylase SLT domain [Corynebacterium epidermidicanis]